MAYDEVPSGLFGANYAFSTPNISISNVDNPSVTDAEAHATTGDSRRILFGLLQDMYTRFNAIAAADRPTKMQFLRSTSVNDVTQQSTVTFTIRFTTDDVVTEVADEPKP
jgi:hypothetical protein